MSRRKNATLGWIGLGVYVAVYDVWALVNGHETLSGAIWRGLTNKKTRGPIIAAILITNKHLLAPQVLPQIDPFNKASEVLRNIKNV